MPETLINVSHLSRSFPIGKIAEVKAVDDVSFDLRSGEILGLVGESGSGKSTVAKCLMNIHRPTSGKICFEGIDINDHAAFKKHRRQLEAERQIIFQDCASSLNPRMKVVDIVSEPMRIHRVSPPRGSYRAEAEFQLFYVGLDSSFLDKYPTELSGGQRQRVAIARAVSMDPKLLVADEPVASLDVSIQAQIINLFAHLREEHGYSILFIAHDLAMVEYLCDRIGVMYRGKLVELADTEELFAHPQHPYTQALLSAIPIPDPILERNRPRVNFDEAAWESDGVFTEVAPGHMVLRGDSH